MLALANRVIYVISGDACCLSKPCNLRYFCDACLSKLCNLRYFCDACLSKPCNLRYFCDACLSKPCNLRCFFDTCLSKPCNLRYFSAFSGLGSRSPQNELQELRFEHFPALAPEVGKMSSRRLDLRHGHADKNSLSI